MNSTAEPILQESASASPDAVALEKPASRVKKRWQSNYSRRENLEGYLFISPWLIGFFAFTLIPILGSLYLAFTDYHLTAPPEWIGLENFERMFLNDARYWKSVRATLF